MNLFHVKIVLYRFRSHNHDLNRKTNENDTSLIDLNMILLQKLCTQDISQRIAALHVFCT